MDTYYLDLLFTRNTALLLVVGLKDLFVYTMILTTFTETIFYLFNNNNYEENGDVAAFFKSSRDTTGRTSLALRTLS